MSTLCKYVKQFNSKVYYASIKNENDEEKKDEKDNEYSIY